MIHAGTMSSGSSRTCGVVGAYWISSINSLRNTTLPSVSAMFSPILKSSNPFTFLPRERVQHETAEEIHTPCVMARHAGDVACRGMPLRFSRELGLGEKVERRTLPGGVTEAPVPGIWPKIAAFGFSLQRRTIER